MSRAPFEPSPRQAFARGQRNAILLRQAVCGADDVWRSYCEVCKVHLATLKESGWEKEQPIEFDHIIALALGGAHDPRNARALCVSCHRLKTDADVAAIAKAERQAGRTGQQARRAARKLAGKAPPMQSKGFQRYD